MAKKIVNELEMEFYRKAQAKRLKQAEIFLLWGVDIDDCEGRITSGFIEDLEPNQIFVFGSNLAGKHGKGAAKLAAQKFGAQYGKGEGLHMQSYALPTKNFAIKTLPLDKIKGYVDRFIKVAEINPKLTFLVTEIGCGLAGYTPEDIAPMFEDAIRLENVHLPLSFWQVLGKMKINKNEER